MGTGWVSAGSAIVNTSLLNDKLSRQSVPRYTSTAERNEHITQVESIVTGASTSPSDYQLSYVAETQTVEVYYDGSFEDGSYGYWRREGTIVETGPWMAVLSTSTVIEETEDSNNPLALTSVAVELQRQTNYLLQGSVSCTPTGSATIGCGFRVNNEAVLTAGIGYTSGTHRKTVSLNGMWTPSSSYFDGNTGDPVVIYLVAWLYTGTGSATVYPTHTNLAVIPAPATTPHTEWR